MSVSQDYIDYVTELLGGLGTIRTRRMFGGAGVYCDELFFALVDDDTLYFKVDNSSRLRYTNAGMPPFMPGNDPAQAMKYYQVPAEVIDDRDMIIEWGREAVGVARNARRKR